MWGRGPTLAFVALLLVSLLVVVPAPTAEAVLPVDHTTSTFFHRDFDTFPTGPVKELPEEEVLHGASAGAAPTNHHANVSTTLAHSGTQSLELLDYDGSLGSAGGDYFFHYNTTLPATKPNYTATIWAARGNAQTSGYTVFRLVHNFSMTNSADYIAFGVLTGDNAVGSCSARKVCFYNTTGGNYHEAADLAWDTWYNLTVDVEYSSLGSGGGRIEWFLNGTRILPELAQLPLPFFDDTDGQKGEFHAFVFQGDGASGRRSQMFIDDLCIRADGVACSSTHTRVEETMTPSGTHIDFNDFRYALSAVNLTHFNVGDVLPWPTGPDSQGWSVVVDRVLEPGCASCQDSASADQGFIYEEDGTWYFFYSMRDGSNPIDAIGLATSTDGENFTRFTGNDGGSGANDGVVFWNNPVGGTWDDWHTYDPADVRLIDGTYWMIYSGTQIADGSGARYLSGLATSTNLTWWERYPSDATTTALINAPSATDCFADAQFQSVVWDADASLYRALVRCKQTEPGTERTLHQAYSSDYITWTMDEPDNAGRILPDHFIHSGSVTLHDGIWFLMYHRSLTPPQGDNRIGIAFSEDGVNWQNTKYPMWSLKDIPGQPINATSVPDVHETVFFDEENGTMRAFFHGPSTDGGRYTALLERPIHHLRGLQMLPGVTSATLTTQPLALPSISEFRLNVNNTANTSVLVSVINTATGASVHGTSDAVTGSGTAVAVTFGGGSPVTAGGTYRIVLTLMGDADESPQVFGLSWGTDIVPPQVSWLLEFGPAWLALLAGIYIFAMILTLSWRERKRYKGLKKVAPKWIRRRR